MVFQAFDQVYGFGIAFERGPAIAESDPLTSAGLEPHGSLQKTWWGPLAQQSLSKFLCIGKQETYRVNTVTHWRPDFERGICVPRDGNGQKFTSGKFQPD